MNVQDKAKLEHVGQASLAEQTQKETARTPDKQKEVDHHEQSKTQQAKGEAWQKYAATQDPAVTPPSVHEKNQEAHAVERSKELIRADMLRRSMETGGVKA